MMKPVKPESQSAPVPNRKVSAGRDYDAFPEPTPLPEVVESNSDTAWGLWQDSVLLQDEPADSQFQNSSFKETEPMGLFDELDRSTEKKPPQVVKK